MLSYFPKPYEGESIYSLISRYGRHVGVTSTHKLGIHLFDSYYNKAKFDVPLNLNDFVLKIPKKLGITSRGLMEGHSLFPYFTAFLSDELTGRLRTRYETGARCEGMREYGGLRFGSVKALRFCPDCCREMVTKHGEMFWRREHQIRWVLVCPEHGTVLRQSTVATVGSTTWYVAADVASCPDNARPVLSSVDGTRLADLRRLASSTNRILLGASRPSLDQERWRLDFRALCTRKGLMLNSRQVKTSFIIEAVGKRFSYLEEALPGCTDFETPDNRIIWLHRRTRVRHHPLFAFMMEAAVSAMEEADEPMGSGPWRCRNPDADHHSESVIHQGQRYIFGEPRSAVFACSCGWTHLAKGSPVGKWRSLKYELLDLDPKIVKVILASCEVGASLHRVATELSLRLTLVVAIVQAHGTPGHQRWVAKLKESGRRPAAPRAGRPE